MFNIIENKSETGSKGTAILCLDNQERQRGTLAGTVTVPTPDGIGGIEKLINEEERAVDLGTDKLAEILKHAELSPAFGMAHIDGAVCNGLFGSVYEDEKGVRFVDFCQQYQNGSFSPKMRVRQSELLSLASIKQTGNAADKGAKQRKARILSKAEEEYLGKFCGEPSELIDIEQILLSLIYALAALPVYSDDNRQLRRMEFYQQLVEIVKDFQLQMLYPYKCYYALTEEEIIQAAQRMGMQKPAFLKKLKEFGFLYLTASSRGYQACIRDKYFGGGTVWRYCIFKFSRLAGLDVDESENQTYEF